MYHMLRRLTEEETSYCIGKIFVLIPSPTDSFGKRYAVFDDRTFLNFTLSCTGEDALYQDSYTYNHVFPERTIYIAYESKVGDVENLAWLDKKFEYVEWENEFFKNLLNHIENGAENE